MPAIADERICHCYRNRDPYPFKANAVKWVEDMGDGTTAPQEICGLPMEVFKTTTDGDGIETDWYRCPQCDRPRSDWPTSTPPHPS